MTRSRAPELRQGHANRGPRLTALPASTAEETVPRAPNGLGPLGQATWRRLWRAAGAAWQPDTDGFIVTMYCELIDRRAGFREAIKRDGWTSRGYNGQPTVHPLARLLSVTEKQLVALEDRLGLNPVSRLRLGISQVRVKSELDRFQDEWCASRDG